MKFEIGRTYWTTSACDADTIFEFTVISRSAKFITIRQESSNREMRVGVKVWDGLETALPYGSYSMAPQITAERFWQVAA